MHRPGHRSHPSTVALDEAFVAAASLHEPSAAERAARAPVTAVAADALTNLQLYRAAVGALLVLLLASITLDALGL
jgi:hypothetical protein